MYGIGVSILNFLKSFSLEFHENTKEIYNYWDIGSDTELQFLAMMFNDACINNLHPGHCNITNFLMLTRLPVSDLMSPYLRLAKEKFRFSLTF